MKLPGRHIVGLVILAAALTTPTDLFAQRVIETVDLPPSRVQGLDMILIDEDEMPDEPELVAGRAATEELLLRTVAKDALRPTHLIYSDLRQRLSDYQAAWSNLPQVRIPLTGASVGPLDPRLSVLRFRLGLSAEAVSDEALRSQIAKYQQAHGLPVDGKAGTETLRSLNLDRPITKTSSN